MDLKKTLLIVANHYENQKIGCDSYLRMSHILHAFF